MTTKLKKAHNEAELIKEQNEIKKGSTCVAVYDLPIGNSFIPSGAEWGREGSPSVFVTKYDIEPSKREYKLFVFKY